MTAAYMFAALLLAFSVGALIGEAYGRRAAWEKVQRHRRRLAERAYDDLTIGAALADPEVLADNARHSRRVLEVVR